MSKERVMEALVCHGFTLAYRVGGKRLARAWDGWFGAWLSTRMRRRAAAV